MLARINASAFNALRCQARRPITLQGSTRLQSSTGGDDAADAWTWKPPATKKEKSGKTRARRARALPLFSFFVVGGFQVHASAASSPPVLLLSSLLPSVIGRPARLRSALIALALMRASIIWRQCS